MGIVVGVLEDGRGGGIVDTGKADEVGAGEHEEGGVVEIGFGFEEDVGGLAWGYEDCFGFEGFYVNGIGFDYGDCVIGYGEEEFLVEPSVY